MVFLLRKIDIVLIELFDEFMFELEIGQLLAELHSWDWGLSKI